MSRSFSSVTAAAIASVLAMMAFALWSGTPGCESPRVGTSETAMSREAAVPSPLGLIDL